jgi:hypothetical protein
VIVQVRRANISGQVVAANFVINPLNAQVSLRMDVTGIDASPNWGGVYVLTVFSMDATPAVNTVTVEPAGGFRVIHRRTGASPAILDVYGGGIAAGAAAGNFANDAHIGTAPTAGVSEQMGYLCAAGVVNVTLPAHSLTRLAVRQHDFLGQMVGAVVLTNQTNSGFTSWISIQGYDPQPRWGDDYVLTALCVDTNLTPITMTVNSGSFGMLHTRLP